MINLTIRTSLLITLNVEIGYTLDQQTEDNQIHYGRH